MRCCYSWILSAEHSCVINYFYIITTIIIIIITVVPIRLKVSVVMQASFKAITLRSCAKAGPEVPFLTLTTVLLVAGAAILRWLAQSVEARGLGEGTSWLITLSIVTSELIMVTASPKKTSKHSEWFHLL